MYVNKRESLELINITRIKWSQIDTSKYHFETIWLLINYNFLNFKLHFSVE